MKLRSIIKWLIISGSVLAFVFISVLFLGAFINLKQEENMEEIQYDYSAEQKIDEENQYGLDETYPKKDTENEIQISEYESFTAYVVDMTNNFNGQSELSEKYSVDNLKYHLVVSSTNYLKYFKKRDEIPDDLQPLIDEGINVTNEFENGDNPDLYYDELKKIHNQLEKTVTKRD